MNAGHKIYCNYPGGISIFFITVLLLFSLPMHGFSQAKDASSNQLSQVEIAGTQLLKITSSICNQEYVLYINVPRGYDDTTKTFPVLFLIDAQWDFPLVQAIYGEQYYDGFIPATIIVGITWGGQNPDYDKRRAHDLTPTDINHDGQYGNAPNFLAFIKKELIPFIESKYRVKKNDRALVGSSFGGLFTLYAMFHEPETFSRYVLTSPALGWDKEIVYAYNKSFSDKRKEFPVKVFMGIGEYENVPDFQKFVDQIKANNYKGIELQVKVIEGMGHSGAKAEGYARGIQFVYSKEPISVAPEILDQYVGEYEINPQFHIKFDRENDHLVAIAPNSPRITIFSESEKDFYIKGQYLRIHFQKNAAGEVNGFQIEQYAGEAFAKKVK